MYNMLNCMQYYMHNFFYASITFGFGPENVRDKGVQKHFVNI